MEAISITFGPQRDLANNHQEAAHNGYRLSRRPQGVLCAMDKMGTKATRGTKPTCMQHKERNTLMLPLPLCES